MPPPARPPVVAQLLAWLLAMFGVGFVLTGFALAGLAGTLAAALSRSESTPRSR